MAAIREAELLDLAKQGFRGLSGALLYGTDDESISDIAREIQKAWSGGEVTVIEATSLRGQQGALNDLLGSQSLFGGRALIVVQGAEDQHSGFIIPIVGTQHANAFLVAAGSLRKNSALRTTAEGTRNCAVLAFHEEGEAAQILRIRRNGSALGLTFEPGAAERLLELCGGNRSLIAAELEKLSLLQLEGGKVALKVVAESCGEQGELDFNSICNSMLDGNVADLDRALASALEAADSSAVLPMLQSYLIRLTSVRAAVEEGQSWEAAFQKAKPPIYFGQQTQVKRQLSSLTLEALLRLQLAVQQIVLEQRSAGSMGALVAARALLSQGLRLSGQKQPAVR
jgi:DNA polymerase III delta subunit